MSYSADYRKRTIEYRGEGHTLEETHEVFKVSISTIRAWEKQWKEKGTLSPAPVVRSYKKINPEKLKAYVQEHPDAYPKEIAREFHCCETAIRKAFDRLGITRKKRRYITGTGSREGKGLPEEIAEIPPEQIAYVDETGIDTYLYREYGYAPRGQKINAAISGHKYKRVGIVAAQLGQEILSPLVYSGTMDSGLFEFWFEKQLLPALPPGAVVVMDNASFHRKAQLIGAAQKYGFRLIFLPPYSPEFNPIENFWAWLKRHLRSSLASCLSFNDAIFDTFQVC